MPARRFLWVIAILIVLVIAGGVTYRLLGDQLLSVALVPSARFTPPPASAPGPDYARSDMWLARPDMPGDAARWVPPGYAVAPHPGAAVFFVAPTAIFDRTRWNAPFRDATTEARLNLFLRGQASVFNGVAAIWSPRYRQATFGAFLTGKPEAQRAIDLAYGDVRKAFIAFVLAQPKDRPIILAAHSQGSLHLLRLLKEEVAGSPALQKRIVAVYAPGWPISVTADLPALGFPACSSPDQTGCILSWLSYAENPEFKAIRSHFDAAPGLTGATRRGTAILCTDPIAGMVTDTPSLPQTNLGALTPNHDFSEAALVAKSVGAHCLPSGILDIGPAPAGFDSYVLPGSNYHVYDYALFWANLRADAERRLAAFGVAGAVAGAGASDDRADPR